MGGGGTAVAVVAASVLWWPLAVVGVPAALAAGYGFLRAQRSESELVALALERRLDAVGAGREPGTADAVAERCDPARPRRRDARPRRIREALIAATGRSRSFHDVGFPHSRALICDAACKRALLGEGGEPKAKEHQEAVLAHLRSPPIHGSRAVPHGAEGRRDGHADPGGRARRRGLRRLPGQRRPPDAVVARRDPRHPPRVPRRRRRLPDHELVPVDADPARGVGARRRSRSSTTGPPPRWRASRATSSRPPSGRASWPARSGPTGMLPSGNDPTLSAITYPRAGRAVPRAGARRSWRAAPTCCRSRRCRTSSRRARPSPARAGPSARPAGAVPLQV